MIKATCYALCAVAILWASSGPLPAETAALAATVEQANPQTHSGGLSGTEMFRPNSSGDFSPAVRLAKECKPDGKSCKKNEQCCSGNCQKGTDMPKGTCLHGD
ncbi:MAG: hypothetical protein WBD76_09580 [Methyloceanibacter sp.]|jgi:hypothetical protein